MQIRFWKKSERKSRLRKFVPVLVLITIVGVSFYIIHDNAYFGDESTHLKRIQLFMHGDFDMSQATAAPGYHIVAAATGILLNNQTGILFRSLTLIFALLSVLIFHVAHKHLHSEGEITRTYQYLFNPILFPYIFLIYTDVFSLFLVVLATHLIIFRRYSLGAIIAMFSVLARQNNILWLGMLFLLLVWQESDYFILFIPESIRKKIKWINIGRPKQKFGLDVRLGTLFFLLGCLLFLLFIIFNGGVALGDSRAHPFPSFHTGNIFFFLFTAFFIFLPLHVANTMKIIRRLRTSKVFVAFIILLFLIYLLTYTNDHYYNQGITSVYLRNRILSYFNQTLPLKLAFFVPMGLAAMSLAVTDFSRRIFYIMYPVTIVFFSLSWLIEQRYYFIPLALFLLFRTEMSKPTERLSAMYAVITTIALFIPVIRLSFFL